MKKFISINIAIALLFAILSVREGSAEIKDNTIKPSSNNQRYQIHFFSVADKYWIIKLDTFTGESWLWTKCGTGDDGKSSSCWKKMNNGL